MNSSSNQPEKAQELETPTLSLETIIAMGLFGWLALSMTLMGLGIWWGLPVAGMPIRRLAPHAFDKGEQG